ncbi:Trehalose utilisation [Singulisphaera sp. GP187]|uniref:ThuA domain-containing protein n=1 Tax=Singulisphaera sp. GP187 TaxID=1882752 RepID=UPI00092BFE4F|nr:ThuA domain-containing protein [Singulisphaera sp. GP187]SIO28588.1 Trehalose utilisation [Singulisphaera sp. GP187]
MPRFLIALAALVAASASSSSSATFAAEPVKVLIITGDNIKNHDWTGTTEALKDLLSEGGRFKVDVTPAPSKDLTDANLAKYDVLVLNYKETPQGSEESRWSDANKAAFLKAVKEGGKGLVVHHFASAAFTNPNWKEYEQAIAGGWRTQGYHGPAHEFSVKKTEVKHPVSDGAPAKFDHAIDELYSASLRTRGSLVLATAYCDPTKPQGTGIDEPVIWVNQYGKGRVFNNVLGHDTKAMSDKNYQEWMRRGIEWAATGQVDTASK